MSHPKPFQAKNVRYDNDGNIVILQFAETLRSEMAVRHAACPPKPWRRREQAMPRASTACFAYVQHFARHDVCAAAQKHVATLTKKIQNIHFPRPTLTLPKFSTLRSQIDRVRFHQDKRVRVLFSGAQFAARFTAIFLFLFVTLNARSYWQVARANLLPDSGREERRALQVMTDPVLSDRSLLSRKLLAVPELPLAGKPEDALAAHLDVAPPDDRLIIPKIGKNVPLISVSDAALKREDWKTFEKDIQDALLLGTVRYPGTALPGEVGNVFVTGHSSNYPWIMSEYNAVLALLPKLDIGDEYSIYHAGELHRYRISKKFEVSPKDISVLEQPRDRRMSTLMTCSPIGTTLRRLILQANEVDPVTGSVIAVTEEERLSSAPKWSAELPI